MVRFHVRIFKYLRRETYLKRMSAAPEIFNLCCTTHVIVFGCYNVKLKCKNYN